MSESVTSWTQTARGGTGCAVTSSKRTGSYPMIVRTGAMASRSLAKPRRTELIMTRMVTSPSCHLRS